MLAIERAGRLRFHCVGDTGGIHNPIPQATVAEAMTTERRGADPVRFFYHLGDIVYLFGEEANYGDQFSAPYSGYDAPIFAIPGNHDGGRAPGASADSLEAFVRHFCLPSPTLPRSADTGGRPASRQPNVFWTLRHDWITIVGLYTNVADGGQIADDQARRLTSELGAAPRGVTLILALHHTRDGRKIPYASPAPVVSTSCTRSGPAYCTLRHRSP
jgi:acid phosphatase type 7